MGWKYGVHMNEGDAPSFNAVVFATKEEADRAGQELLNRWLAPYSYSLHEVEEEANYEFPEGADRPQPLPGRG